MYDSAVRILRLDDSQMFRYVVKVQKILEVMICAIVP